MDGCSFTGKAKGADMKQDSRQLSEASRKVWKEFTDAQSLENRRKVSADPNRLQYHLMAPVGWLNDPNGLCQLNGTYHIFYQYTPGSADGADHRGWGHYTTRDLIHYQEQDDALVPDSEGDGKGAYSGSAFKENGKLHFFYTGNNKLPGDFDYINEGRIHWTMHFSSDDGLTFTDKEVLMKNADYPDELSCHVRDPKILKDQDGVYYMVLGARTRDSRGQAEIFSSQDLQHWKHASTIRPASAFGYMWECPDLFDLDGHRVLITCPQGVPSQPLKYENIYQNGWFEIHGPLNRDQTVDGFTELDHGFDFYAPQSFEDEQGRRILIGWMGIPDADYTNPTVQSGWQHALTLPRVLSWKNGRIYQQPAEEILRLRQEEISTMLKPKEIFRPKTPVYDVILRPQQDRFVLHLRTGCILRFENGVLTLKLEETGSGRTERHARVDHVDSIEVFSDTSSLEIFVNGGETVFTTRIYDDAAPGIVSCSVDCAMQFWTMGSFQVEARPDKNQGRF